MLKFAWYYRCPTSRGGGGRIYPALSWKLKRVFWFWRKCLDNVLIWNAVLRASLFHKFYLKYISPLFQQWNLSCSEKYLVAPLYCKRNLEAIPKWVSRNSRCAIICSKMICCGNWYTYSSSVYAKHLNEYYKRQSSTNLRSNYYW